MHRYTRIVVLGFWIAAGCNALDKPASSGVERIVPTDTRSVEQALRVLPAISGGTLAVSPDGRYAVAADPDRDRISIVALAEGTVQHVMLDAGDEPGRVEIDTSGRAFVALRRAGDLASVDLQSGELLGRTHVCSAPRGVASDVARGLLHVACADGRLVSLRADDMAIVRDLDLGTDLRDVLVRNDGLVVSAFKGASVSRLDVEGNVMARATPEQLQLTVIRPAADNAPPQPGLRPMQPHMAWRTVQSGAGSTTVFMLHQDEAADEVVVDAHPKAGATQSSAPQTDGSEGSAYGGQAGGPPCQGIVTSSVTRIEADGSTRTVAIDGAILAVDMAISPLDGTLAIAQAGVADFEAPRPFTVFRGNGGTSSAIGPNIGPVALGSASAVPGVPVRPGGVMRLRAATMVMGAPPGLNPSANCEVGAGAPIPGQATAVAYTPTGELIVQSREPARLAFLPAQSSGFSRIIELGGDSVLDTGHELFHRDSGAGIACASCHGEGAEDGHTWLFSNVGARRTQALHVGLKGTAPFHWNGDMQDIGALMENVFVGRMGGVHQSEERVAALTRFLFALRPPTAMVDAADPAAVRGKMLFASGDVGCASCHQGDKLTNNQSYDVGTGKAGERLQVPSLHGVGYRAPFIHTGCAETLRQRFDPSCGGQRHGHTSQLDEPQIDDLIAYLRSL